VTLQESIMDKERIHGNWIRGRCTVPENLLPGGEWGELKACARWGTHIAFVSWGVKKYTQGHVTKGDVSGTRIEGAGRGTHARTHSKAKEKC